MSDLSQTPNATTVVTAVVLLRVGEGKAARIVGKTVLPAPVLLQLLPQLMQMTVMRRASSPCSSSERMTLTCSTATPTSAVDSDVCFVSLYNSFEFVGIYKWRIDWLRLAAATGTDRREIRCKSISHNIRCECLTYEVERPFGRQIWVSFHSCFYFNYFRFLFYYVYNFISCVVVLFCVLY